MFALNYYMAMPFLLLNVQNVQGEKLLKTSITLSITPIASQKKNI
jgi:hypothetical protein